MQKDRRDGIRNGLAPRKLSQGNQEISFAISSSLDGPLKDFLENIEKSGGPTEEHNPNGLQQVTSRSQSLEGPLKEYLDNIEQAFIRAKFRICSAQPQPLQNTNQLSPIESVSIVQETKDTTDSEQSQVEKNREGSDFKSVSATREEGEVVSEPIMTKQRKCQKLNGRTLELRGNKSRNSDNRGGEQLGVGAEEEEDEAPDAPDALGQPAVPGDTETALLEHRPSQAVTPDRSSQLLHDPVDIQELSIDRMSQRTHPVNPSERRPPIDQSTVDPSGRSSRRDLILRIPWSQVDERGPSSSSARTDPHVPEQTPPPLRHGD
ncbi:hypothetical protein LWI29_033932 [Acer saccharum]|uniref:Uncharacterized protein n=1 Tax=Acer saccharum TaxID=4024 RepID=A0AA39W4Q8_ACESA|nr:hypothetical protein LWI29_033932 [Acer saccharum]